MYLKYLSHTPQAPDFSRGVVDGGKTMDKYVCGPCGYVYDPEVGDPDNGIAPGTGV